MKLALTSTLAAITATSILTLGSGTVAHAAEPIISVDGSSTVYPITEAAAEEFQTMKRGKVRVTVGISGTGGGFKRFCRGETDVQDASRPIQASEMETCKKAGVKYIELPIAFDAIAVVVNPKNTTLDKISVEDLKKMWVPEAQGKVTKWSDVNPKWPADKLKLFGAGADSGTFDYFTEAIVGKSKSSRGDYTASEDDNTLVQGIASDKGALGYIPFSYYEANKSKLKLLAIDGGAKAPKKGGVAPSRETVENGTYYPLSRPLFIYVSEAALKRPEVKEFAQFYLDKAVELVPSVKEIPLPAKAYKTAAEHLNKGKLGTVFGGKAEVGLKIDELLKREGTM
jgi:phosphate transport system substrate-binding protein